jgi:hypothetical protein
MIINLTLCKGRCQSDAAILKWQAWTLKELTVATIAKPSRPLKYPSLAR